MSDIRQDPEVVRVYKEMGGTTDVLWGVETKPLLMPLGDLAFFMRDKMETEDLMWHWNLNINDLCSDAVELDDRHMHSLRYSTPEQWIRAACAAWRMK